MRRLLAIVMASVSVVGVARAQPGDELHLTWTAPPGCPSGDAVRSATLHATATGRSGGGTSGEILEANALVEERTGPSSWRVHLRTRRGSVTGEREIEGPTCSGVADATAVLLALALVPPTPLASATPSDALPGPTPTAPTEAPTKSPSRGSGAHHVAVGAAVAGDPSSLPALAVGAAATLAWTPGRFRLEADGRYWGSQSRSVEGTDTGARFSTKSIGGRACWAAIRTSAFDASPCGGADAYFVSAPGYGADTNYQASASWTSLTGSVLGRIHVTSWLAARARVDAFVPLTRPTFVVENEGSVHRPPTLGVSTSLGVEVLFL